MTAPNWEDIALVWFLGTQALGAVPDLPPIRGPFTWILHWVMNTLQSIVRNADKLPLPPGAGAFRQAIQSDTSDGRGNVTHVASETIAIASPNVKETKTS